MEPINFGGDSWEPQDLQAYLDGTLKPEETSLGSVRMDGLSLLYEGREHTLIGFQECGKSWLALDCAVVELHANNRVIYVHMEETSPRGTVDRLRLLNARRDAIMDNFIFIGPDSPCDDDQIQRLVDLKPTLVIIDGTNEGMSLLAANIIGVEGVAEFRRRLVKPFTGVGAAVLSLDHTVKDSEAAKSGFAYGSVHKGASVDGASFMLVNQVPFGRGRLGRSTLQIVKDRPGYLREFGDPTPVPRVFDLAMMTVDSRGDKLEMRLEPMEHFR